MSLQFGEENEWLLNRTQQQATSILIADRVPWYVEGRWPAKTEATAREIARSFP
jgi:hypothetical protein